MMGRAQAKLLIPEPGNARLPKKKAPAFAELRLFFPPAFSLVTSLVTNICQGLWNPSISRLCSTAPVRVPISPSPFDQEEFKPSAKSPTVC